MTSLLFNLALTLLAPVSAHATPAATDPLVFRGGLQAQVIWEQGPIVSEESSFRLEFKNAAGLTVDPNRAVDVSLWMPSMGHGSAPTTTTRLATGIFRVTRVFFIMPGDWDVRVTLTAPNGTEESKIFSLFIENDGNAGPPH